MNRSVHRDCAAGCRAVQGRVPLIALDAVGLSIPIVSGVVGWATNWLAIQMSFYPVHFIGHPPFLGWQGVVPRKVPENGPYLYRPHSRPFW